MRVQDGCKIHMIFHIEYWGWAERDGIPHWLLPLAAMFRVALRPRPRYGAKSSRLGPSDGRADGALVWIAHESRVRAIDASSRSVAISSASPKGDSAPFTSRSISVGGNSPNTMGLPRRYLEGNYRTIFGKLVGITRIFTWPGIQADALRRFAGALVLIGNSHLTH